MRDEALVHAFEEGFVDDGLWVDSGGGGHGVVVICGAVSFIVAGTRVD